MNNILFSHKIHTELYLNRTRPILKKMIDNGLIDDFINLVNKTLTIETFCKNRKLLPEFFTEYDYNDIYISNSLLLKIKENPNNIHISSDNDIDLITKIMMKKYLLENIELNEHKVNIQVKIENTNEYIKVVSYNNIDKNTKNPKLEFSNTHLFLLIIGTNSALYTSHIDLVVISNSNSALSSIIVLSKVWA
jgi:hypothetical protein